MALTQVHHGSRLSDVSVVRKKRILHAFRARDWRTRKEFSTPTIHDKQGADDGLLRSRRPRHVVVEEAAQEKKSRALLLTVEKNGADQEGAVLGVLGEGRQRGLRDRLPT